MLGFRSRAAQTARTTPDPVESGETVSGETADPPGASELPRVPADGTPLAVPPKRLGSILVEEHLVSQAQIEEALAYKREHGGFLGQILVEMGYISQNDLVLCLVKQCRIPHISLLDYDISKEVLQLVPKELCQTHNLIPIDKLGRILTVAMVNPLDTAALDEVKKVCPDLRIKPILCDWQHLQTVFTRTYGAARQNLDEHSLPLGPKRQFDKASEPDADVMTQLDAVAKDLIQQSATERVSPKPAIPQAPVQPNLADAPASDITAMVRESVGGILQDAMANLMAGNMGKQDQKGAKATTLSRDDLNWAIRESVADAVREVMAVSPMPAKTAQGTDLSAMIRESVAAAMQETLGGRNTAGSKTQDEIQTLLRAAVQEALRGNEAAAVARTTLHDLEMRDAERLKRQKHAPAMGRGFAARSEARIESDDQVLDAFNSDHLLDEYRFETFVVGKGNAFTVKLCRAVASQPGGEYNPFFIYGDVGLGKTHLVNAIGNAIAEVHPDMRIGYVSASRFATRLAEAQRDDAVDAFRSSYGHWDVLILDDIQFLGGRVEAQEEFFHIFNALQQQNRQIIIAGDKPPDRLGMLEQRLISRFSGGIVANVRPPEFEARVAILERIAEKSGATLSADILALVARRVTHDMRKMIGALRKIMAYAKLQDGDITPETANDILIQLGIVEAA